MNQRPGKICTVNAEGHILGNFDFDNLKALETEAKKQYVTALNIDTRLGRSIWLDRARGFEAQWRRLLSQALKQNLIEGTKIEEAQALLAESDLEESVKLKL